MGVSLLHYIGVCTKPRSDQYIIILYNFLRYLHQSDIIMVLSSLLKFVSISNYKYFQISEPTGSGEFIVYKECACVTKKNVPFPGPMRLLEKSGITLFIKLVFVSIVVLSV